GDAPPVHRLQGEGFEDEHVEHPLQHLAAFGNGPVRQRVDSSLSLRGSKKASFLSTVKRSGGWSTLRARRGFSLRARPEGQPGAPTCPVSGGDSNQRLKIGHEAGGWPDPGSVAVPSL